MARLVGVDIPNDKRVVVGLTYIYGIGSTISKKILTDTRIDLSKRVKDLSPEDLKKLYDYIEKNVQVEGQVKQKSFLAVKRLKDIRSYRGNRHKLGLPVRGQNTRTNAKTRKGRSIAVGGLNNKITKK